MITTFLYRYSFVAAIGMILAFALCILVGYWLVRPGRHRQAVLEGAAVLSAVLVLAITLTPSADTTGSGCNLDLSALRYLNIADVANAALFVPVAFFCSLLTRRPAPVLLGACLASAAIEGAQALLPHLGRLCDAQDLVTNASGAAVGSGSAALVLMLSRRTTHERDKSR